MLYQFIANYSKNIPNIYQQYIETYGIEATSKPQCLVNFCWYRSHEHASFLVEFLLNFIIGQAEPAFSSLLRLQQTAT